MGGNRRRVCAPLLVGLLGNGLAGLTEVGAVDEECTDRLLLVGSLDGIGVCAAVCELATEDRLLGSISYDRDAQTLGELDTGSVLANRQTIPIGARAECKPTSGA